MDIKEYKEYLESEVFGYINIEESSDYDKIQVLREAVEERFLNDELSYEEYAMVIDRLDEKEAYLEAKVDDWLASDYIRLAGYDSVEDAKRGFRDIRREDLPYDHPGWKYRKKFGGSPQPRNSLLHYSVNVNGRKSIKDPYSEARYLAHELDAKKHDSKLFKKYNKSSITRTNHDDNELKHDKASNNVSKPDNGMGKSTHDSLKGELVPVQQKALLVKQTAKVLEEDKKSHKKMISLIATATAVGLGAGVTGIIAAKRQNADKMCADLTKIQDRLTDLGAERTTTLKLLTSDRKSLAKTSPQDKDTAKELAKEIKKNEMKLKKIDAEIFSLTRKVEVIKSKLEKMKKKVD